MSRLTRAEVFALIDGERAYQDTRWGPQTTSSGGQHSPAEWLVYIQDYLTEAIHFASRIADPESAKFVMSNLRKIAAMSVAAMEQNGAPRRLPWVTTT